MVEAILDQTFSQQILVRFGLTFMVKFIMGINKVSLGFLKGLLAILLCFQDAFSLMHQML